MKLSAYPRIRLGIISIVNMNKFSFQFLFCLINIIKPNPAFTDKPATNAPNESPPIKNSSVNTTLEAQFGIKPISTANSGCRYRLCDKKFVSASSPIHM